MPRIINAYSGNQSVADSLKSLGDSMFGNQAQRALIRENAAKVGRENVAEPAAADAFRSNDPTELGAQFIMAGRGAGDFNGYYRGRAAIAAGGNVDDPMLNTAMLANGGVASTPVGQGRENAAALVRAKAVADAQAAERAREFNQNSGHRQRAERSHLRHERYGRGPTSRHDRRPRQGDDAGARARSRPEHGAAFGASGCSARRHHGRPDHWRTRGVAAERAAPAIRAAGRSTRCADVPWRDPQPSTGAAPACAGSARPAGWRHGLHQPYHPPGGRQLQRRPHGAGHRHRQVVYRRRQRLRAEHWRGRRHADSRHQPDEDGGEAAGRSGHGAQRRRRSCSHHDGTDAGGEAPPECRTRFGWFRSSYSECGFRFPGDRPRSTTSAARTGSAQPADSA